MFGTDHTAVISTCQRGSVIQPNLGIAADRDPRERGSRPLNTDRWAGASRRPNGTGVMHALLPGATPANRSFKLTVACSRRTPGVRPRSSAAA